MSPWEPWSMSPRSDPSATSSSAPRRRGSPSPTTCHNTRSTWSDQPLLERRRLLQQERRILGDHGPGRHLVRLHANVDGGDNLAVEANQRNGHRADAHLRLLVGEGIAPP